MSAAIDTLEYEALRQQANRQAQRLAQSKIDEGYTYVKLHEYTDANGRPLYWKIRLEHPEKGKWMRPLSADANVDWRRNEAWRLKKPEFNGKEPLYRLADIANSDGPVWIVEGEACADALARLGLTATTSGGNTSAKNIDWTPFKGRDAIVWPDNDKAGLTYAKVACEQLRAAQVASIRVVDVSKLDLTEKGDVVDWLRAHPNATAADIEALPMVDAPDTEPADDWPLPREIGGASKPDAYPLEALPKALRDAVTQYQHYGGQPMPMVACSALAVAAVAAQGLANVRIDARRCSPLSLSFLMLARSGERKTSLDKEMAAPLAEFERDKRDAMQAEIDSAKGELAAWEAEHRGIKSEVTKLAKHGDATELNEAKNRLTRHEQQRPHVPELPILRYENVTPEGLAFNLARGWPSAAVWSDEAGIFFGSHGMSKESVLASLTQLNRLWDGNNISHTRKVAESVYLSGRRLGVNLMVQSETLIDALAGSRGLARGTGFLARYLICWPVSTMGERPVFEDAPPMPALEGFHARIRAIFEKPLPVDECGRLTLGALPLSRDARAASVAYAREVEAELKPFGELRVVADFASKSQEQAARLAGVLHVYEHGANGEISGDTMRRAIALACWYVREARRVTATLDEPLEVQRARLLDEYLAEKGRVRARDILQIGPHSLRRREVRDAAVKVLEEAGRARQVKDGYEKWIERNPRLQDSAKAKVANLAKDSANFSHFSRFSLSHDAENSFSDAERGDEVAETIERAVVELPISAATVTGELAPEDLADIRAGNMTEDNVRAFAQSLTETQSTAAAYRQAKTGGNTRWAADL